jgi:riboflavin synthase
MFTGIIEDVGVISAIRKLSGRWELGIRSALDPAGVHEGDSIAVDGVCLTVVRKEEDVFFADASLETLNVTTLKEKSTNDHVNLEQAMPVNGRLGGHIVMGHVDGIGAVASIGASGDSIRFDIEASPEVVRYIVKKGSVTIDGISLTVNDQSANRFSVNIIPYSASKTTIGSKKVGDRVNVETDVLGRYVEKFIGTEEKRGLDLDFLYKYGYIKGR